MRAVPSGLSRRLAGLSIVLAGAVVLFSSCSIDAAVTIDRAGRVLSVNALRMQSSMRDLGLVMLLRGRELAVELSWGSGSPTADSAL